MMPSYRLTSPEGKKYKVTVPEGTSQEEIYSYINSLSGDQTQEEQPTEREATKNLPEAERKRFNQVLDEAKRSNLQGAVDIGSVLAGGMPDFLAIPGQIGMRIPGAVTYGAGWLADSPKTKELGKAMLDALPEMGYATNKIHKGIESLDPELLTPKTDREKANSIATQVAAGAFSPNVYGKIKALSKLPEATSLGSKFMQWGAAPTKGTAQALSGIGAGIGAGLGQEYFPENPLAQVGMTLAGGLTPMAGQGISYGIKKGVASLADVSPQKYLENIEAELPPGVSDVKQYIKDTPVEQLPQMTLADISDSDRHKWMLNMLGSGLAGRKIEEAGRAATERLTDRMRGLGFDPNLENADLGAMVQTPLRNQLMQETALTEGQNLDDIVRTGIGADVSPVQSGRSIKEGIQRSEGLPLAREEKALESEKQRLGASLRNVVPESQISQREVGEAAVGDVKRSIDETVDLASQIRDDVMKAEEGVSVEMPNIWSLRDKIELGHRDDALLKDIDDYLQANAIRDEIMGGYRINGPTLYGLKNRIGRATSAANATTQRHVYATVIKPLEQKLALAADTKNKGAISSLVEKFGATHTPEEVAEFEFEMFGRTPGTAAGVPVSQATDEFNQLFRQGLNAKKGLLNRITVDPTELAGGEFPIRITPEKSYRTLFQDAKQDASRFNQYVGMMQSPTQQKIFSRNMIELADGDLNNSQVWAKNWQDLDEPNRLAMTIGNAGLKQELDTLSNNIIEKSTLKPEASPLLKSVADKTETEVSNQLFGKVSKPEQLTESLNALTKPRQQIAIGDIHTRLGGGQSQYNPFTWAQEFKKLPPESQALLGGKDALDAANKIIERMTKLADLEKSTSKFIGEGIGQGTAADRVITNAMKNPDLNAKLMNMLPANVQESVRSGTINNMGGGAKQFDLVKFADSYFDDKNVSDITRKWLGKNDPEMIKNQRAVARAIKNRAGSVGFAGQKETIPFASQTSPHNLLMKALGVGSSAGIGWAKDIFTLGYFSRMMIDPQALKVMAGMSKLSDNLTSPGAQPLIQEFNQIVNKYKDEEKSNAPITPTPPPAPAKIQGTYEKEQEGGGAGNDKLSPDIVHAEGLRLKAYNDHLGNKTVGYGFNMDDTSARKRWAEAGLKTPFQAVKRGRLAITPQEAKQLANYSYKIAANDAKKLYPNFSKLSKNRQQALINMSYQMGLTNLSGFKDANKAIANGRFNAAVRHFAKSRWVRQTPERARKILTMLWKDVPYDKA